jgi:hypothetical protein
MKSVYVFAVFLALVCGGSGFARSSRSQYSCNDGDMTVSFSRNAEGSKTHGVVSLNDPAVVDYFRSVLGNDFSDYYNGIGVSISGGDVFCGESENFCSIMVRRSEAKLFRSGGGYLFEIKTDNAAASWFFESCRLQS